MKEKIFRSPARYIQGRGVLARLPEFSADLGDRCLLVLSEGGVKRNQAVLEQIKANGNGCDFTVASIIGENSIDEINRMCEIIKEKGCNLVAGIGGGKIVDAAKAIGYYAKVPVIVAPTVASSDAPCSPNAVINKKDGSGQDFRLKTGHNPDLVLIDSALIASAPVRLFASGMGDALSTYFEMKACWDTDSNNVIGSRITLCAKAIATQCYQTLMEDGVKAFLAVKNGICTEAVENVIEANILLSGLGFENGGVCAAHPINGGLSQVRCSHPNLHGEYIAFTTIAQMVLSNESLELIRKTQKFIHAVGLPVTLAELGIEELTEDDLTNIGQKAFTRPAINSLPRKVDPAAVMNAVIMADVLGREYLASNKEVL